MQGPAARRAVGRTTRAWRFAPHRKCASVPPERRRSAAAILPPPCPRLRTAARWSSAPEPTMRSAWIRSRTSRSARRRARAHRATKGGNGVTVTASSEVHVEGFEISARSEQRPGRAHRSGRAPCPRVGHVDPRHGLRGHRRQQRTVRSRGHPLLPHLEHRVPRRGGAERHHDLRAAQLRRPPGRERYTDYIIGNIGYHKGESAETSRTATASSGTTPKTSRKATRAKAVHRPC